MEHYLRDRADVRELEAWLLTHLQPILDSKDDMAIRIANRLDADLIQLGEGLIDASDLARRLELYIGEASTVLLPPSGERTLFRTSTEATTRKVFDALPYGPTLRPVFADLRAGI